MFSPVFSWRLPLIIIFLLMLVNASLAWGTEVRRLNSEAAALFAAGKYGQAAQMWEKVAVAPAEPGDVGAFRDEANLGAARAYRRMGKENFSQARARLMEIGCFESDWEANLILADIYWEEGNFIPAVDLYDKAFSLNPRYDGIPAIRKKNRNQAFGGVPAVKTSYREPWVEPKPDYDPCRSKMSGRHASLVENGREAMLCAELKDGSDDRISFEIVLVDEKGQVQRSTETQDFPLLIWEAEGKKRRLLLETEGHAVRFVSQKGKPRPDVEVTWNSNKSRAFFLDIDKSHTQYKTVYSWDGSGYVDRELEKSRTMDARASALFAEGKRRAATKLWQQGLAVARKPSTGITANGTLLVNLGNARLSQGDRERAGALFDHAVAVDPLNWGTYLRLGDYYADDPRRNERLKAVPNYEKLLILNPSYAHAERIKRRIAEIENIDGGERNKGVYTFEIHPSRPLYSFRTAGAQDRLDTVAVSREGETEPVQELELSDTEDVCMPREHPGMLATDDFNFDGYRDLAVSCSWDTAGNEEFAVWLFDPGSGLFVFSESLSALPNPVPAPRTKVVFSRRDGGDGGRTYREGRYVWEGGDLVLVREEEHVRTVDGKRLRQVVRERKDGVLTTTGDETTEAY